MKKLSTIAAGALLSAVVLGGPAVVSTAVASASSDAASHHAATNRAKALTKRQILALLDRWNAAVETGDPE